MEDMKKPFFNVPYPVKSEGMVGQEELLQKIRQQLTENKRAAVVHAADYQELGGPGRTWLAVEYVYRYRDEYPGGVIWISVDRSIEFQLIRIAKQAGWVHPEMEHPDVLKDARQNLNNSDCLIIYDNVVKLAAIEPFLPWVKTGPHVLVTAREALKGFTPVEIPLLDDEPSLQRLLNETQGKIDALPDLQKEPLLNDVLDFLAWSGVSFMGVSLMTAVLVKKEPELSHSLSKGVSLRLLQKAVDGERYQMHPLIRKAWRDKNPIKERNQWVDTICQRLGDWFEQRRKPTDDLPAFEAEITHLQEWGTHAKDQSSEHECRLTWLQAYPPYYLGNHQESLKLVQSALSLIEKVQEPDLELKANLYNDLGSISGAMGDHDESITYHLKALEIQREHLGEEHPDTINSIENVGTTYSALGEHEETLKYHLQALEIRKKVFGERHPDTAGSFDSVGDCYDNLGEYSEGMPYHQQALEIQRELLGEYHPDTAAAFFNVVYTMVKLRRFSEAGERLTPYLEGMSSDHPEYERYLNLRKFLNKERIKGSSRIPSKKKKKKKKK
ncbi:MAG: tetratricopeptide repeat protein [Candidatus Aminicenantes bacterium]|nr:tetratricopeptide repeat protein [Candidatus Aminicenantes bacterium]NIM83588.1 tetratricopeptide repeat protein [Candidatus Aminicenantes bacterium]NIN22992.1 tetratricopeptide repeat protein [Candidatus Aminicenantes bacterium]NIN46729.1 tetratricopeptide repeat protein [Candidatus Aminicenantes bacterium]NIN89635.1 tetratricopeptide repeat protein [Candidatus Aminicenantes bacterium]